MLCSLLAGCGGGGAPGTPTAPDAPAVEPSAPLAFDAGIQLATRSRIAAILSAADAVGPGAASIRTGAIPVGSDVAVIATDVDGELLLAGYASSSGAASLGHASTARFLARLRLSQLVSGGLTTRSGLDAAIAASPALAPLSSEIATSLAAGTAPIQSEAVLRALAALVADVQATLSPGVSGAVSASPLRAAAVPGVRSPGITPMPHALVPSRPGAISAVLLGDEAGNGVTLLNNSLLAWRYRSDDLAGTPLQAPGILDGISFWSSLRSVTVDGRLNTPQPVRGNGTQFVVTAALDSVAIGYNVGMITVDLVSVGLSDVLGQIFRSDLTCASRVIEASINEKLPALLVEPTLDNLRTCLRSMFTDAGTALATLEALRTCLGYTDPPNPRLAAALAVIARVNLAIDLWTLSSRLNQLVPFAATRVHSVEVCKQAGAVVPCALTIAAPSQLLAVHQSMPLTAMVTARNAPFPVPAALTWRVDRNSEPFGVVDASGVVTATGTTGSVTAHVASPYGDAASYSLQTYVPIIAPVSQTLQVGQRLTFALVDPQGMRAVLPRPYVWTSSAPAVATVDPVSGAVEAVGPVSARVVATDPAHPLSVGANVSVVARNLIPTTLIIRSVPNPSATGGTVTLRADVLLSEASGISLAGLVRFRAANGDPYCDAFVSDAGTGQCTTRFTTAGARQIVGSYSGDADFAASNDAIVHTVACADPDTIIDQGPWGTIRRKGCAALKRGGSMSVTDLIEYTPGTDGATWGYLQIYAPTGAVFSLGGGAMEPGYNNAFVIGNVWGSGNADPSCMAGMPDAPSYSSIRITVPSTYSGSTLSVGSFYFRYNRNCYIHIAGRDGFMTFPVVD